jgi:hypothetical protein
VNPARLSAGAAGSRAEKPVRQPFVWDVFAERLADALSETRLDALCKQVVRADLRRAHPDAPMYFI